MANTIEKLAVTTLPPKKDFNEAMQQQWGYVLIDKDGNFEFKPAKVSELEKRHALINFYFIEEKS